MISFSIELLCNCIVCHIPDYITHICTIIKKQLWFQDSFYQSIFMRIGKLSIPEPSCSNLHSKGDSPHTQTFNDLSNETIITVHFSDTETHWLHWHILVPNVCLKALKIMLAKQAEFLCYALIAFQVVYHRQWLIRILE